MPEINYILVFFFFYAIRKLTLQKYTEIMAKEERKSNRLTRIIHQVNIKSRLLFNILTVEYRGRGGKKVDKKRKGIAMIDEMCLL